MQTEGGVVVGQTPLLDVLVRCWSEHSDAFAAQHLGGGEVVGVADGLVPGPRSFVVGDQPTVAERPDPVQVHDQLDPAADHRPDPAPEKPRRPYEERHTKQSFYMTEPVYEQLRRLAFDEKRKMQHYLREGLDRVFRDRGLPSIAELEKYLVKEDA